MPCNIIAADKGNKASKMPIKIIPPAMPRMPEMNEVISAANAIEIKTRLEDMVCR
jgi:hypothetical protein